MQGAFDAGAIVIAELPNALGDIRQVLASDIGACDVELVFLESGGDNLAASFSPELVDVSIYVIDVAGGDKVPRKGGPGVTRSDLLVINKTDLAPNVGADLGVMARDAAASRGGKPVIFTNLKRGDGLDDVIDWIRRQVLFEAA